MVSKRVAPVVFSFIVLVAVASGCAATTGDPNAQEPTSSPDVSFTSVESSADKTAALVKSDLAVKLAIQTSDIKVLSVAEVQWNDSSLGCPEEGKVYLQVIIPGYLIKLEANGKTYEYHTDLWERIVLATKGVIDATKVVPPPVN